MTTIKTVLCPVDFSDHSRHALAHAVQIARWFESTVTVLHVYPSPAAPPPVLFGGLPGPIPPVEPYPALTSSPERTHEETLARLSDFTGASATGIRLKLVARAGAPIGTILDESARLHSDLIVLGTHGHSGFEHWMLGSVTERVLRKAACPVLTVPPPVETAPGNALKIFSRILCAVDFSEASLRGLEYALMLAKEADAEVMLMHVIEGLPNPPDWQQPPGPAVVEYLRLSEENALTRLRQALPAEYMRGAIPTRFWPPASRIGKSCGWPASRTRTSSSWGCTDETRSIGCSSAPPLIRSSARHRVRCSR